MEELTTLSAVLEAVRARTPDEAWVLAKPTIARERDDVLATVAAHPENSYYGFSTLLGHLDGVEAGATEQQAVLDAHLVGTATKLSGDFRSLLVSTKLAQLGHGGTGLSAEAYDGLLQSLKSPEPITGAWTSSYSSGDVVPAAWLVRSLQDSGCLSDPAAGDVIALLSGNFVAAGIGTLLLLSAADELTKLTYAYIVAADQHESDDPDVAALLNAAQVSVAGVTGTLTNESRGAHRQPSVTLRDAHPALSFITSAVRGLALALNRTLDRKSGNPLFDFNGEAAARSQSSFLDFELTAAITTLTQAVHLAAGLWQRLILHGAAQSESQSVDGQRFVQPPKVANAVLERMRLEQGMATNFTGSDSNEIEDLRDLSLASGLQALRATGYLRELAALAEIVDVAAPASARFTDVWWKTVTDGSASASDADRFAADIDKLRSL